MDPLLPPSDEQITTATHHLKKALEALGIDLSASSMAETPRRVAEMYAHEVFSGLYAPSPQLSFFTPPEGSGQRVICTRTEFTSFCEHHLVPMVGHAYIAYLPNQRLAGLSDICRLAKHISRRPQLQERAGQQIADALEKQLETEDVAVVITAQHACVRMRGPEDSCSETMTEELRGAFIENPRLIERLYRSMREEKNHFIDAKTLDTKKEKFLSSSS